jgi:hypothetical protein
VSSQDRRQQRQEIRYIQSESAWLQKALFALHKAEAAREKLEEAQGRDPSPYALTMAGERVELEVFEEALEARAQSLLAELQARRQVMR